MTLTTRQRVHAGTRDARVVRRGTKRTHHAQLTFRFVVPTVFTFLTFLCFHARVTVAELGTSAHDLSNFQGKHACAAGLRMAIPQTVGDVAAVVAAFPKVRAVGVGHSWNKQMFCAGEDANAVDVVSSQVRSVNFETDNALGSSNSRALLGSDTAGDDTNRGSNPNDADADSSRFEVNLSKMTVKSDAGATVRDVLDFLENHRRGDGDGDDDDDELLKQESSDETQSLDVLRSLRDKDVSSDGYTLPAFPWFVDQTIGGAVATATHGSSLRHGSLSSQLTAMTLVLANGTVVALDEENTEPHVFRAARTNLGRLGVVVDVTMRIVRNHPVRKTSFDLTPEAFVRKVEKASAKFAECEDIAMAIDSSEMTSDEQRTERRRQCATASPEMRRLDETQAFWFFPLGKVTEVSFSRLDDFEDDLSVLLGVESHLVHESGGYANAAWNTTGDESPPPDSQTTQDQRNNAIASATSRASGAPHASSLRGLERRGVVADQPRDAPRDVTENIKALGNDNLARLFAKQWERASVVNVASGVFPARKSYLTMSEQQYDQHDQFGYDQYETCVPMRLAGQCLATIARATRDENTGDVGADAFGFRSQGLIRFVNEESGYLAPTNGLASGTCMYVNIEDFVRYADDDDKDASPDKNKSLQNIVSILRSNTCRGRLHWGKAGWPSPGCFNGPNEFGKSWCHFQCVAFRMDPGDKFVPSDSVSDVFSSSGFDRETCCGFDGTYLSEKQGCECKQMNKGFDLISGDACPGETWN